MANQGDGFQVRTPYPTSILVHGLSYSSAVGSNCVVAGCEISQAHHPMFPTYGVNALHFTQNGGNTVYYLDDTLNR